MKSVKIIIVAAEIAAIICLCMTLYFCAQREEFDFCLAALCGMFAIVAVILQAMNDEIAWDNSTNNVSSIISECIAHSKNMDKLLAESETLLNETMRLAKQIEQSLEEAKQLPDDDNQPCVLLPRGTKRK